MEFEDMDVDMDFRASGIKVMKVDRGELDIKNS